MMGMPFGIGNAAIVATAIALAVALAGRWLARPGLAAAAAGIGLAAGFVAVLGLVSASPRQLAERLPLLAVLALGAGGLAGLARRPAIRLLAFACGLVACAWWMAGAPLHLPDLRRAAPEAALLLAAMALAAWRGAAAPAMLAAWAALAAGVYLGAARGPHLAFALAGLGAALGALPGGALGPAARLPLAVALVGVAAVPVLARAAPADLAAAAAPLAALLAGPMLARRLPGRAGPWLGPLLAALPVLGLVVLMR
jgi:hypothetical protein